MATQKLAEIGSVDCECSPEHEDLCITTEGTVNSLTTQTLYCRTCMTVHGVLVGGELYTHD